MSHCCRSKKNSTDLDTTMLTKHSLLCTEVKAIRKGSFCLLQVVVLKTGQVLFAETLSTVTKLQDISQAKGAQLAVYEAYNSLIIVCSKNVPNSFSYFRLKKASAFLELLVITSFLLLVHYLCLVRTQVCNYSLLF